MGTGSMEYVSFHTHTDNSHGDGFGPVPMHVDRVVELGMSALGLSEHGNTNSHVKLEQECRRAGIKPIYGCEIYYIPAGKVQRKFHLTIFAMNDVGYHNLSQIVTQSYLDFYQFPTVHWDTLEKYSEGLAVFSGCADSLISCTLLGGKSLGDKRDAFTIEDYRNTRREVLRFADVFTPERFFLEVQRFHQLPRTCVLNPAFAQLAADTGVRLIASSDVHYPYPFQNKMQTTIHAARRKSSVAIAEASWEYDILLTYPTSDTEILDDLIATGLTPEQAAGAVHMTTTLAGQCNVTLPKAKPLTFPVPQAFRGDRKAYLKALIKEGWKYRVQQRPELELRSKEYFRRVNDEFKIVIEKGFVDYFLATADLVIWSKDEDITVGPARGSAAASLVCYLLRITEIDPLHPTFDKMVFERFLDPTRSDPPDIDLDFDDELRYKTADQARRKYGNENVAAVGNHIRYRGKRALQDVARAYHLSQKIFEPISRRVSNRTETDGRVDDSILDVLESYSDQPDIAQLLADFPTELEQATWLEGNQHSMGIHAAGFVISSEPIPEICPIYTREKGSGRNAEVAQVIPYDKRDAEYLGFLKADFLGLKAMGMIGLCRKWTGMSLDELYTMFYSTPEWEHERILESFLVDDVVGIFQYEGGTTRNLMRRLKPTTFDHLAAVGALSRPGPFYGGQAEEYIAVKNGEKDWDRIHPEFDKHVEWTYGQIVYQEQIMWILRDLAGFDVPTVLRVRKIIGKKLGEHQFAALWEQFRDGCLSNGVGENDSLRVWGAITTAAGYAFNIPHAYSYALIAWWQMWFKIHNPAVFFAASLARNGDGKDEIPRRTMLLQDCSAHGRNVIVENFDVEYSAENWTPSPGDKGVAPGYRQIPGVGPATAEDIAAYVKEAGARINGWDDLLAVKGIGKITIQKIQEFVSKPDPLGINKTRDQIEAFRKQLESGDFDGSGLPSLSEYCPSDGIEPNDPAVAFVGLISNIVFRDEVETAYSRRGGDLSKIRRELEAKYNGNTKKATIFAYDEFGEVALRVSAWGYPRLAAQITALNPDKHMIVAWGRTYDSSNAIQVKAIWVLDLD